MTEKKDRAADVFEIVPVAYIHTEFHGKFGIPRQSGLADAPGRIVLEPEYRREDALRGIEMYSHLWLLWKFLGVEREKWSPTVRPPRLGGNTRIGVFATRSPFRPNPIGLSCVKLERVEWHTPEGPVLYVSGVDILDQTPILDIKPYLPYVDCHPEADGGFAERKKDYMLQVYFPEELRREIPEEEYRVICQILSGDPRPSYQKDETRIYGMEYGGWNIRFRVKEEVLTVCEVSRI